MIDTQKISFITCVNNERIYEESILYLQNLIQPPGFSIEFLAARNAKSMTSGYNQVMRESNAKYKIYLHQDIFIVHKHFLTNLLDLFMREASIGMIGLAGCARLPFDGGSSDYDGIWWHGELKYGMVDHVYEPESIRRTVYGTSSEPYSEVQAIDGLVIATQYDLPWREELFSGWHFYDISQSLEFARKQYKVVIPRQIEPWCVHACGSKPLDFAYEKYRTIFLKEYNEDLLYGEHNAEE